MNVTLLKGIDDSGNLVTIAVDSDGNMVSVMQGHYAGSLKTLALDEQGRIKAVLTDPEDVFGNPNYMGAAELAVRLGSIVNFDRRGSLIWQDDFEGSGLNWTVASTPAGGTAALDTGEAVSGLKSCKVVTPAGNQEYTSITKGFAYPIGSQIGAEIAFLPDADLLWLQLHLCVFDGTNKYESFVRVYPDEVYVNIYTANSGWVSLTPTNKMYIGKKTWYKLKLVIDYVNKTNVRVLYNDQVYNTTTYTLRSSADASNPHIHVEIKCVCDSGGASTDYLDNFILTQNEP